MRMNSRTTWAARGLLTLCAALLGDAAWAQASAPAGRPVRIGFICPLTGGSQDFGNSARMGAELAAKEMNEVGGYLGRNIELVIRDDKANPDEGRKVAENLVLKEKVDFTISFCNTGVAMKSLSVFQDNKHLLLVPVAADKTDYGEGGFNDVLKFLADRQLKPVYTARFDLGVKSLAQEVADARAAGADVIVGYSVGPEMAVLAQARTQSKFTGPLYGPWPLSFRTVADNAGSAAAGAIMVQTIIQDLSNERRSSFIARLRRHSGQQAIGSLMAAAQSYDAVQLMLRVMFQTRGDTLGAALKAALENLERPYSGVVTTHDKPFSATDHDAFTRNMIWLGVWRKGEIQFQYPEDAKHASIIRRKQPA